METVISEETYVPGDKICLAAHARNGSGTYVRDGFIYASLFGKVKIEREMVAKVTDNGCGVASKTSNQHHALPVVSIKTLKENTIVMPHIGSLVMARVTSVNPRYAKCAILSVNNVVVKENFPGQVNRKDIRATEKDKVEVNKSFRCNDIIIARVISLGDTNSYFLSCAENELGVVIAYSEAGHRLVPISWNEMQCPVTMLKEHRKVAKIQPEFITYADTKQQQQHQQQQQQTSDGKLVVEHKF